jgi:hypothetical protein
MLAARQSPLMNFGLCRLFFVHAAAGTAILRETASRRCFPSACALPIANDGALITRATGAALRIFGQGILLLFCSTSKWPVQWSQPRGAAYS